MRRSHLDPGPNRLSISISMEGISPRSIGPYPSEHRKLSLRGLWVCLHVHLPLRHSLLLSSMLLPLASPNTRTTSEIRTLPERLVLDHAHDPFRDHAHGQELGPILVHARHVRDTTRIAMMTGVIEIDALLRRSIGVEAGCGQ